MIYTLTCTRCRQGYPRAEFRKRGGGLHKLCPKCRKKEYAARSTTKKRMLLAKQEYDNHIRDEYVRKKTKTLQVEFNRVTRLNRTRIRILKANTKPTKATTKNLAYREKQQAIWQRVLDEMLTKVRAGEQIPLGLCEYYTEHVCTDRL